MKRLPLLLLLLLLLAGCRHPGYTPAEEAAAREIMSGRPFYDSGKGTPAEFMTNLRGQYNPYGAVLRGEDIYPAAVQKLAELRNEAQLGFDWKHPVPEAKLPRLTAPRIDGIPEEAEWRNALRWEGEFVMSCDPKTAQAVPSVWCAGWDERYFYLTVRFPDDEINALPELIHNGDCLELFIRPCGRENIYFEFIVNPDGILWMRKHAFSDWGGSFVIAEHPGDGVLHAAKRDDKGYSVELAIPFDILHSKWNRRSPRAGDSFSFMAARINLDGKCRTKSAPVPFLYDGHNVFGYFNAELIP